jgi:hypothetical protein
MDSLAEKKTKPAIPQSSGKANPRIANQMTIFFIVYLFSLHA